MTDEDLGKLDIFETDKAGSHIDFDDPAMPSSGRVYLESLPVLSPEGLVGTGTTCYRAREPNSSQWDYIVKFKWR